MVAQGVAIHRAGGCSNEGARRDVSAVREGERYARVPNHPDCQQRRKEVSERGGGGWMKGLRAPPLSNLADSLKNLDGGALSSVMTSRTRDRMQLTNRSS
jgi:hypothetical protein